MLGVSTPIFLYSAIRPNRHASQIVREIESEVRRLL